MQKKSDNYKRNHEYWLNVGKAFLKCQRTMNKLLSGLDITIAQHEILLALDRNKGVTHKELSEKLLVVKSNVSNLVKKLEQRGLVQVTPCLVDQRVKRLSVTNQGQALVKESTAVQKLVVTTMMDEVSAHDLEATNRVMLRALESLDSIT